jgi:hypothetical protein
MVVTQMTFQEIPCFKDKEFTQWWHCNYIDMWKRWIPKDIKKSLEIGSFEGMSAIWLMDYCPDIHVTCVDTFSPGFDDVTGEYEQRFERNVAEYGERVTKLKGRSADMLKKIYRQRFDLIYIDGDHTYEAVKKDAELAWPLLRRGGLLIFDDYNNDEFGVRQAVDEFLIATSGQPRCIMREPDDYQMCIEK